MAFEKLTEGMVAQQRAGTSARTWLRGTLRLSVLGVLFGAVASLGLLSVTPASAQAWASWGVSQAGHMDAGRSQLYGSSLHAQDGGCDEQTDVVCEKCSVAGRTSLTFMLCAVLVGGASVASQWQRCYVSNDGRTRTLCIVTALLSCLCAANAGHIFHVDCLAQGGNDGVSAGVGWKCGLLFTCIQALAAVVQAFQPSGVVDAVLLGISNVPSNVHNSRYAELSKPKFAMPPRHSTPRAARAVPITYVDSHGNKTSTVCQPVKRPSPPSSGATRRSSTAPTHRQVVNGLQRLQPVMSIAGAGGGMDVLMPGQDNTNAMASANLAASPAPAATAGSSGDAITAAEPLHVVVAGAGVGGLALANALVDLPNVKVTVLETTNKFKRFGGPIQLASNAMSVLQSINFDMYNKIEAAATFTGDKVNGIKDGIRNEWYSQFDLGTPAKARGMQYTCVVERPDLQEILLERVQDNVNNSARVSNYKHNEDGSVDIELGDGSRVHGDVLIGADGIWSAVRASMRDEPAKGDGSGVSYSGYTVFAGELYYDSPDNGQVGYKVYIGPGQYFVITDIGKGRYQWYAFLAKPPGSAQSEPKPDGTIPYLRGVFEGWSEEIHAILKVTKEDEAEQRDLYDRPPSVMKDWNDGHVTLLGDSVHAMMPNLGQGGCQAIEDAKVISEELAAISSRSEVPGALREYRNRRLLRSATVQGLSRFASDIIIKGFDTPAKISFGKDGIKVENLNYAGVVTRVIQPFMPIFFSIQFNFLYSGWRNEPYAFEPIRDLFVIGPGVVAGGLAVDSLLGGEAFEAISGPITQFFTDAADSGIL